MAYSLAYTSFLLHFVYDDRFYYNSFRITFDNGLLDWTEYMFTWEKSSNILSMYVNSSLLYTTSGAPWPSSTSSISWQKYINIGGLYHHLSSFNQNFGIRDLKIWQKVLTSDTLSKKGIQLNLNDSYFPLFLK